MTVRVLVAGGANIDIKVTSSRPPVEGTSTPGRIRVVPGGVARNVAEALARLGAEVSLLTVVGDDPWSTWLIAQTEAAGVGTGTVVRRPGRTGFFVAIDGRGVADSGIVEAAPAAVWGKGPVGDVDILVLDANPPAESLARWRRRTASLAVVGTSPVKVTRFMPLLDGAWLCCLTEAEAWALLGERSRRWGGPDLAHAIQDLGPAWVLLTAGDHGLGLLGETWVATPAPPVEVVNATGAGDTAAAVVLLCLFRRWDPPDLLSRAARAAAMTVGVWENVHPLVGTVLGA